MRIEALGPASTSSAAGLAPAMVGSAYTVMAPAAATATADIAGEVVVVHQPGDVVRITEVLKLADGRRRGKGPAGWISFRSERGVQLLTRHTAEEEAAAAGAAAVAEAGLIMPTGKMWSSFHQREGLEADGCGPVDAGCVARAVRELLPGFGQTAALRAAYQTMDVDDDGAIDGRDLKLLFRRIIFFGAQWSQLEELRRQHGDTLDVEGFASCCRSLRGAVPALSDVSAGDAFAGLQPFNSAGVHFDKFLSWLAAAVETKAGARQPATRVEGRSRPTVQRRGLVERAKVYGEPTAFGSGVFGIGTRIFADSGCVATGVPTFLQSARLLALPQHETRPMEHNPSADYVSFIPGDRTPIRVCILFAQVRHL